MSSTPQTLPTSATSAASAASKPSTTQRPRKPLFTPARIGIYAFLISVSAFFLLPLYVMLITSLKTPVEIRQAAQGGHA